MKKMYNKDYYLSQDDFCVSSKTGKKSGGKKEKRKGQTVIYSSKHVRQAAAKSEFSKNKRST